MNRECCSMEEVRTIFRIIVEHATAVDRARKPNSVNRSRWWNWIAMLGIWTLAIGLIVYQVERMRTQRGYAWQWVLQLAVSR